MNSAGPAARTLDQLYEDFSKAVYWAAFGVLKDKEYAADAMQNVFLSAYRHMDALNGLTDEQCRAWLYKSAVNAGIDMLRRNKRLVPVEDAGVSEADSALGPEERAQQSETRRLVNDTLSKLPDKYREPLTLYYFAQLDYKQIAALLNTNEGTLKSRMSRGRAMMEKLLRKGGGIDD